MPRPNQFDAIQGLRQQRQQLDRELEATIVSVEAARRERDRLRAQGADKAALGKAEKALGTASDRYRAAREARLSLLDQLAAQSAAAAADLASAQALFDGLEGDLPVALFPVRLETRYTASTLQIRIYPDAVNIQSHTDGLTATEQKAGRAYWQSRWDALGPRMGDESDPAFETDEQYRMRQQRPQALWAEMLRALRAPRASFVVRVMRPANAGLLEQPGVPTEPPAFPQDVVTGSRLATQPVASMLPDRFCAVGYAPNGKIAFRRFGKVVPDVLAMSPVIEPGDAPPPEDAAPPFSGESAWLSDFAAAEAVGMGITIGKADITLAGYDLDKGLSRLVVFGIDWTLHPEDASGGVAALLAANGASGGIGFLPVGTPTNNTSTQSTAYSPARDRDPDGNIAPAAVAAPGTRAIDALRTAFGMREGDFDGEHVAHSELDETELAGHMANALYRGLAGNYLENYWTRADSDGASDAALGAVREHVVRFVRPAGPLQPLRIDRQPYGILPVVASDRYQPADDFERGLNDILKLLRPSWSGATGGVPRFDGTAAATNTLLRQGPWAQAVSYREVKEDTLGSAVQDAVGRFQSDLRFTTGGFFLKALAVVQGMNSASSASLAALAVSRLVVQPDPNVLPRNMPWVQADAEVKTREAAPQTVLPAESNYIEALAAALDAGTDIKGKAAGLRKATSLLAGLLAYSVDQEADQAASLLLQQTLRTRQPTAKKTRLRAPMTVGIEEPDDDEVAFGVRHAGELSKVRIKEITGDDSITTHAVKQAAAVYRGNDIAFAQWHEEFARPQIQGWLQTAARHARDLASVRASLEGLKGRTVGELNWALRTTLDMFDWRLDAWLTSQATRRLAALRAGKDADGRPAPVPGVHVGAWGFVEDLKPDPAGNRESLGHMLTPSMRHAAAAAILRSGYLSNEPAARSAYDLDLSSRRVRAANAVYEGLAQGQTLAALLGYRFERGLRDLLLGEYILSFRRRYPMRPVDLNAQGNATDNPTETIAARDVVDGVKLLEAGTAAAGTVPNEHRPRVQALLAELNSLWDAVADLGIAESTYQIAQGNVDRAAAALSVIDKQTTPVEAQVGRSPRDGVTYTQRVAMLFDTTPGLPPGWSSDAMSVAEPRINAWLAQLVGDPGRFVLRGRVFIGDTVQNEPIELHPQDLGLSPQGLMYALDAPGAARPDVRMGAAGDAGPADGGFAELSRLRLLIAEAFGAAATAQHGPQAFVHIEEIPADRTERGLVHLEALLGLARRLVMRARPAVQRDLAVIDGNFGSDNSEGDYPGVDAAELEGRAVATANTFTALGNALTAAMPANETDPIDTAAIEAALAALRIYGVLGVERDSHRSFNTQAAYRTSVRERARLARADIDTRLSAIGEQRDAAGAAGATAATIVQAAIDTLKTVFGKDFTVVPVFRLGEASAVVNASLGAQTALTQDDPVAVPGWLPKMAKVREGVDNLQSLLLAREMLVGSYDAGCFGVLQSPVTPSSVWAALPGAWPAAPGDDIAKTDMLAGGRHRPELAVALHAPTGLPAQLAADTPLAALVCDDWAETVPLHTSTAAIAFHYDAPGARPPQTILLAVPPRKDMPNWSFDDLLATVNETIELARLRAVCPAQLSGAVNLALPMNVIQDAQTPDVPGFDIKHLASETYAMASVAGVKVLAVGKV